MEWYLPVIWSALIGTAVVMYVILDGFDLGLGILFPTTRSEAERDQILASIAPFWNGNETWLVLGGGGLWVAFPNAYAVIMPALYIPVLVMLLGLIFRGVAFEFRSVSRTKIWWNRAFVGGSVVAAFAQGMILGGLIQGIKVENGAFAGGALDWATAFAALCGISLVAGYALLGATWIIMKTEGEIAGRARKQVTSILLVVLACMAIVSLWTPLAHSRIADRWFSLPNFLFLWPVPFVTALLAFGVWKWAKTHDALAFLGSIGLFLLGYIGLVISNYPYLVPPSMTVWDTAAVPASQIFMLVGTLFLLPMILGYFVLVYWLFRGKVAEGGTYH